LGRAETDNHGRAEQDADSDGGPDGPVAVQGRDRGASDALRHHVSATGAGQKTVEYIVIPGRAAALTTAELEEFKGKKPVDEVVARLLEN
jgi:hypothetical protein